MAEHQTLGRGRGERSWISGPGNFHASLLLKLDVPLSTALQLPFVAGVAVHDAICDTAGASLEGRLWLKWPNDVLLGGQKVCGIHVESRPLQDGKSLA